MLVKRYVLIFLSVWQSSTEIRGDEGDVVIICLDVVELWKYIEICNLPDIQYFLWVLHILKTERRQQIKLSVIE